MRHVFFPLAVLLAFLAGSCDPDMVYDRYEQVAGGNWSWEDEKSFPVEITDTTGLHNIYLQVRHTVEYPMSNLYMFVRVEGPGGQQLQDTVNMILAEPDGAWKGSGPGKLRELQLLYRKQARFATPGTYKFTLEQGMRRPEVPVTDVGVRIEQADQ